MQDRSARNGPSQAATFLSGYWKCVTERYGVPEQFLAIIERVSGQRFGTGISFPNSVMHQHDFPRHGMVQTQFRFPQQSVDECIVDNQFASRT